MKGVARCFNNTLILDSEINYNLYKLITESLEEMYGKNPDPLIEKRVQDEWTCLQNSDSVFTICLLLEIVNNLVLFNIPYSIRHSGNASFILYLLGITNINPLPPHFHCLECHSVSWDHLSKCGLDLAKEKHCHTDNSFMYPKGFNIPWEPHLLHAQDHCFFISISPNMYEDILHILSMVGINYFDQLTSYSPKKHMIIEANNIIFHFNLPNVCFNESPMDMNNVDKDAIIEMARQYALTTMPDLKVQINSFSDIISYLSILRTTFSDDTKLKVLINTLCYNPSELITCREDLYQYFIEHGCNENIAFKLMSNVRKGKYFLNNFPSYEMHTARDKWVVGFCEDIRYLPSKTEIIEDLLFNLMYLPNNSPFQHILEY